jgi:hypothetical protein
MRIDRRPVLSHLVTGFQPSRFEIHVTAFLEPNEVRDPWLSDDTQSLHLRRPINAQVEKLSV